MSAFEYEYRSFAMPVDISKGDSERGRRLSGYAATTEEVYNVAGFTEVCRFSSGQARCHLRARRPGSESAGPLSFT